MRAPYDGPSKADKMIQLLTIDLMKLRKPEDMEQFAIHCYSIHPNLQEQAYRPEVTLKLQMSPHVWFFNIEDGVSSDSIYAISYFTNDQLQHVGSTQRTAMESFSRQFHQLFKLQLHSVEVLSDDCIATTYKSNKEEPSTFTPEVFQKECVDSAIRLGLEFGW